jgi:hypothetical protein
MIFLDECAFEGNLVKKMDYKDYDFSYLSEETFEEINNGSFLNEELSLEQIESKVMEIKLEINELAKSKDTKKKVQKTIFFLVVLFEIVRFLVLSVAIGPYALLGVPFIIADGLIISLIGFLLTEAVWFFKDKSAVDNIKKERNKLEALSLTTKNKKFADKIKLEVNLLDSLLNSKA